MSSPRDSWGSGAHRDPQHVRGCYTAQVPSSWSMAWCLHGWAWSQAAVMWGTSCPSLEDPCMYTTRLQGALQKVASALPDLYLSCAVTVSWGGLQAGSIANEVFCYKLAWTIMQRQGISLGPNPLPAWVIWHLLWSSYQVIDEPDIYFFSVPLNNLSSDSVPCI